MVKLRIGIMNFHINKSVLLFILIAFAAGLFVGIWGSQALNNKAEVNTSDYPLLSKRITIDNPSKVQINFTNLRLAMEEYLAKKGDIGKKTAVYFEYLPVGTHIEINENSENVAASLMKLPFVMSLYKASENGQIDLDDSVALKEEWLNSEYGTLYEKGAGYRIQIRELARLALTQSDNTAILAVFDLIKGRLSDNDDVLSALDIKVTAVKDGSATITPYSYSSILKCLYFSCYVSNQSSQEILEALTNSSFNNRLTKFLPSDVKTAHKIGTFSKKSHSDCGIIYLKDRNYILCIMTVGSDAEASPVIADISKLVYDYMVKNVQSETE